MEFSQEAAKKGYTSSIFSLFSVSCSPLSYPYPSVPPFINLIFFNSTILTQCVVVIDFTKGREKFTVYPIPEFYSTIIKSKEYVDSPSSLLPLHPLFFSFSPPPPPPPPLCPCLLLSQILTRSGFPTNEGEPREPQRTCFHCCYHSNSYNCILRHPTSMICSLCILLPKKSNLVVCNLTKYLIFTIGSHCNKQEHIIKGEINSLSSSTKVKVTLRSAAQHLRITFSGEGTGSIPDVLHYFFHLHHNSTGVSKLARVLPADIRLYLLVLRMCVQLCILHALRVLRVLRSCVPASSCV